MQKVWDPRESFLNDATFTNCGYSPIAIIFSVIAAGILLLSAILLCLRRFEENFPPVVGTSTAAISAACHPFKQGGACGRGGTEELVYES